MLLASSAPADEAAPPSPAPVVVKLKDGRTLEGALVRESKDEILLRLPLGDIPIGRGEIVEIVRAAPAAQPQEASPDEEEPATEEIAVLTLDDGSVLRGRLIDHGEEWEIEGDLGTVRVKKRQVRDLVREVVPRRPSGAAAALTEREEAVDLALGVALARPSAAWKFAERVPDPLARILMRREDPDVIFRVALAEAPDPERRDVEAANRAAMETALRKELSERFRASRNLSVAPDRWRGLAVWRVSYQADTRVFGSRFSFREIRIPWRDVMLVLQASAPLEPGEAAESARAAAEADLAFESFGFSGPIEAREDRFASGPLGFRLARPRPDWKLVPHLLDPEVPVEALSPDGAIRCWVSTGKERPAGGAVDIADALEKSLAAGSRFWKKLGRQDRTLGGTPAVELRYQDFCGGTKLLEVRRLIVVRGGRLFELFAARPATEAGPAKSSLAEAAIDALFAKFEVAPFEAPLDLWKRGARAIELRVSAEKKLDEKKDPRGAIADLTAAIEAAPDYGLAYVLRAKAYSEAKDDERALRDYDAASELLDDPAIARLVAKVENSRGKSLAKEDWPQALKLLRSAAAKDPKNRAYREDVIRALIDHARGLASAGRYEAAIEDLRAGAMQFPEEARFSQETVKTHVAWARALIDEGELYRARSVLQRALRIAPDDGPAKTQLDRVEREIKKKEEGQPKKGKTK
jgi:tetratricopeptide (TPR) repeat protein